MANPSTNSLNPSSGTQSNAQLAGRFAQLPGEELIALRDRHTKHFNLGGGRFQAITYAEPVHFRPQGQHAWQEIDNTLEPVSRNGRSTLKNRCSALQVELDQLHPDSGLVSLSFNGHSLRWGFEHAALPVSPILTQGPSLSALHHPSTLPSELDRRMDLSSRASQALFEHLAPGLSVRYSLSGETCKEDILLLNRQALAFASLRLFSDSLSFHLQPDSSVRLLDSLGHTVFRFLPPVAFDALGREASVSVRLTPTPSFTRLQYLLDDSFLDSASFPITIDPVVMTEYSAGAVEHVSINSTFVDRVINGNESAKIYTGNSDGPEHTGTNVALFQFPQLVQQRASDTIVYAALRITPSVTQSLDRTISCHEVLKEWHVGGEDDGSSVKWRTFNPLDASNVSTEVLDYVKEIPYEKPVFFDITNLYRRWYKLENGRSHNFGVALRQPDGVTGNQFMAIWSADTNKKPRIVVNYISHAGLEDWWQFEDQSLGRSGTAHVGLFNGNLVFEHSDSSMNGNLMPVSVSHFYNSCLSSSNEAFCGYGWRTSLHQSVHWVRLSSIDYYVWTDGDGTEHYFPMQYRDESGGIHNHSTPYKDSEGMGLEADPKTNELWIEDKQNTRMVFLKPTENDPGKKYLLRIRDALDNKDTLAYHNDDSTVPKVLSVTDGAGRVTSFSYNAAGLLSSLSAPGCLTTHFVYSGQNLIAIRYGSASDAGTQTSFSYLTGTSLLGSATNGLEQLRLDLTYEDPNQYDVSCVGANYPAEARRVTSMTLSSTSADGIVNERKYHLSASPLHTVPGSFLGPQRLFDYQHMCTVVSSVKQAASDPASAECKKLFYQFNDNGNVVCVRDELGFAKFTKFPSDASDNKPQDESDLQKAVVNRLSHVDLEDGWLFSNNPADTIGRDASSRCLGLRSLKFTKTTANVAIAYQNATLPKSGDVTFSAFVKTAGLPSGSGAFLRLVSGSRSASSMTWSLDTTGRGFGPTQDWVRLQVSLKDAPAGSIRCELACNSPSGVLFFSAPQLEDGFAANSVNLLANGDFSLHLDNNDNPSLARKFPLHWTPHAGISSDARFGLFPLPSSLSPALSGSALQLVSHPGQSAVSFFQDIVIKGNKNDVFVLGGWANTLSVPKSSFKTSRCGFCIKFANSSQPDWSNAPEKFLSFNREHAGWQFACFPVVAPEDFLRVRVYVTYTANANLSQFSNLFLFRERFGRSFVYDQHKNLTSVANRSNQQSSMVYDDFHNLTSYRQAGSDNIEANKHKMTYGDSDAEKKKHLLRTHTTPEGVRFAYSYDAFGNKTSERLGDPSGSNAISSSSSFISNGNYPSTSTDSRGLVTSYSYATSAAPGSLDSSHPEGTLRSVTDPKGQTVFYSYDSYKRITKVSTSAGGTTYQNQYSYHLDRLSKVSHNGFDYSFVYDPLGRLIQTTAAGQLLSTNSYSPDRFGWLQQVTYGNGQRVRYLRDPFGRLSGTIVGDEPSPRFSYHYAANGKLASVDLAPQAWRRILEYDLSGRLSSLRVDSSAPNGGFLFGSWTTFNKLNLLAKLHHTVGSYRFDASFSYDRDNRLTRQDFSGDAGDRKAEYLYDNMNRITSRKLTSGTNVYTTSYSYLLKGDSGSSLPLLTTSTPLISSIDNDGSSISYTYDDTGNILTESRDDLTIQYFYDPIGQLIRVNDQPNAQSWTFSYDNAGNILSKRRFAYSTAASLPAPAESWTFSYPASGWKDQLQAVSHTGESSRSLSYDLAGNLISDGIWTFSWDAGRQLKMASGEGKTLNFQYDENGLRTSKTSVQDGVSYRTNYYYMHDQLSYVSSVDNFSNNVAQLFIHYGPSGRPVSFEFLPNLFDSPSCFWPVYNLQGDVIQIVDTNKVVQVQYSYDPWGNLISSSGPLANTLGKLNPFRYRGYVYDDESGLYYLKSRYYRPAWGRFINSDNIIGKVGALLAHNVFCYCLNNINSVDPSGHRPERMIEHIFGYFVTPRWFKLINNFIDAFKVNSGGNTPNIVLAINKNVPKRIKSVQYFARDLTCNDGKSAMYHIADFAGVVANEIGTLASMGAAYITHSPQVSDQVGSWVGNGITALTELFLPKAPPPTHQYQKHELIICWDYGDFDAIVHYTFSSGTYSTLYLGETYTCNHFDGIHAWIQPSNASGFRINY